MVDLGPTAEPQQIVESIARFLGSEMPVHAEDPGGAVGKRALGLPWGS